MSLECGAPKEEIGATPQRSYPTLPMVGVAGVVIDGERVLLIRRGREPMLGCWSLPGGALQVGETMVEGVEREVLEETGVRVAAIEMVATLDRIVRDGDGRVRFHYVLIDWVCRVVGAAVEPVAGDDAMEAAWVERRGLPGEYGLDVTMLRVIDDSFGRMPEMAG